MSTLRLDPAVLDAAADWLIRLRYDSPDEQTHQAFSCWLAQSDAHAQAWARAQAVMGSFERVPSAIGLDVLRSRARQRRALVRAMAGGALFLPAAWLGWRQAPRWSASLSTATGERRNWQLEDGSQLMLNTGSAVDVRFSATERRLVLVAGEVLITTAKDAARPLLVQTAEGEVQALGTRFIVRQFEGSTQVAVFEHAVELRPEGGTPLRLEAGQTSRFTRRLAGQAQVVDASASAWEHGMLVVRDWPLADVVAELQRYRPGFLRCDPAVAGLRVSGALSVADTDAALQALAAQLPVQIRRVSKYWVTVGA